MSGLAFRFDLGRLSLNFVATVGARPSGRQVERLVSPAALHDWFVQSGLAGAAHALPALGQDELAAAIELREVLYRLIHDIHHGRQAQAADVDFLNALLRAAQPPVPQLRPSAGPGGWTSHPLTPLTTDQLLALIARDAVDLLAGDDRTYLRECAGPACDGIYVDRSKGFRRQWCSSKTCGNQARVDRFREKAAAH